VWFLCTIVELIEQFDAKMSGHECTSWFRFERQAVPRVMDKIAAAKSRLLLMGLTFSFLSISATYSVGISLWFSSEKGM
jgi:hypothetical protein